MRCGGYLQQQRRALFHRPHLLWLREVGIIFACHSSTESGTWSEHTDGLLGLAYSNLYCSPSCYATWIDEFIASGC